MVSTVILAPDAGSVADVMTPFKSVFGCFTSLFNFSKLYSAGVRYSSLGKHGDEGEDVTQIAYQITRQLTETSKFRIQHNVNDNPNDAVLDENVTLVQFIFGMGPHSHVLQ